MSTMKLANDQRSELLALTMLLGRVRAALVGMHDKLAGLVTTAKAAMEADDLEAYDAAHEALLPLRIEMAAQYGRLKSLLKQERQLQRRMIDGAQRATGEEVGP